MKTIIIAVSLFLASSLYAQTEPSKKAECAKPETKMICGQLKILLKIIKEDTRLEKIKENTVSEHYVKKLMEYYNCEEN